MLRQPAVRREMLVSQVLRLVGSAALVPVVAQAAPQEPRRRARQQRATSPFRLPRRAVRVATEAGLVDLGVTAMRLGSQPQAVPEAHRRR
jgi:hypothetical protein